MITISRFLSCFRITIVVLTFSALNSCDKDVTGADPAARTVSRLVPPRQPEHDPTFRFAPLRYDFMAADTSAAATVIRVLLGEGRPPEIGALRTSLLRGADVRVLDSRTRSEAVQAILRRSQ